MHKAKNAQVPGLILSTEKQVRRFINCLKANFIEKEKDRHNEENLITALRFIDLDQYRVSIQIH
jgi:hypothetical protein